MSGQGSAIFKISTRCSRLRGPPLPDPPAEADEESSSPMENRGKHAEVEEVIEQEKMRSCSCKL